MRAHALTILLFLSVLGMVRAQELSTDSIQEVDKKVSVVAVPLVNYNNSYKFSFGAFVSAFFKVSKRDTISPKSQVGVAGAYATNKSGMVFMFSKLYFNQDKYRVLLGGGLGSSNFQYYPGVMPFPKPIQFNTKFDFLFLEGQREIIPNLYGGLHIMISEVATVFDLPDPLQDPETGGTYISPGFVVSYDNRSSIYYPQKGFYTELNTYHPREKWGSSHDYDKASVFGNYYVTIANSVLASRIYGDFAFGDVPFQAESVVGGSDLRGYTKGEYRGDIIFDLQTEWRSTLYKRFGYVAFAGIATAGNDFESMSEPLYSLGAGIRYKAVVKDHINIGFDAAVGKNDWGIYFRITEAF